MLKIYGKDFKLRIVNIQLITFKHRSSSNHHKQHKALVIQINTYLCFSLSFLKSSFSFSVSSSELELSLIDGCRTLLELDFDIFGPYCIYNKSNQTQCRFYLSYTSIPLIPLYLDSFFNI